MVTGDLEKINRLLQLAVTEKLDFEIIESRVLIPALSKVIAGGQDTGIQFSQVTRQAVLKVIQHDFKGRWFKKKELDEKLELVDGPSPGTVAKLLPEFCAEGHLEKRGSKASREYLFPETDFTSLKEIMQKEQLRQLQQARES